MVQDSGKLEEKILTNYIGDCDKENTKPIENVTIKDVNKLIRASKEIRTEALLGYFENIVKCANITSLYLYLCECAKLDSEDDSISIYQLFNICNTVPTYREILEVFKHMPGKRGLGGKGIESSVIINKILWNNYSDNIAESVKYIMQGVSKSYDRIVKDEQLCLGYYRLYSIIGERKLRDEIFDSPIKIKERNISIDIPIELSQQQLDNIRHMAIVLQVPPEYGVRGIEAVLMEIMEDMSDEEEYEKLIEMIFDIDICD